MNLSHLKRLVLRKLRRQHLYAGRLGDRLSRLTRIRRCQGFQPVAGMDYSEMQSDHCVDEKDMSLIQAHGLTVVGKIEAPVKELRVQYRSEFEGDSSLLIGPNGEPDRSIVHSPLCRLLNTYESRGFSFIEKHFRITDYYKLFSYYSEVGYIVDWATGEKVERHLTEMQILEKIQRFIRTYESIKQRGYLGRGFISRYIMALEAPFEVQRFGLSLNWHPYEIWSGHHRAAALAVLGYEKAVVILLKSSNAYIWKCGEIIDETHQPSQKASI